MLKFQRNYETIFDIGHLENGNFVIDRKLTITYPLTISFNISIGAAGSANEGKFQFCNLSPDIRKALWLDNYNIGKKVIYLTFKAGYQDTMPVVFLGKVQNCVSYKDSGSTEWKTDLQVFEGGFIYQYGYINSTYIKGTSYTDILNDFLSSDTHTKPGYITKELGTLDADKTFIGQTMDVLQREFEGYDIFINKGDLNILGDKDVLPSELPVLTDSSGLLGSPRRSGLFLEIDMLFEPQLNVGQSVVLKSKLLPELNQEYKLIQINHSGTISAVTGGNLTSNLTLALLEDLPNVLTKAQPLKYSGETSTNWVKPVKGKITSPFGIRVRPNKKASINHEGIDIGADAGTPIFAPADGTVIMAKLWGNYGKIVQIDHGELNGVKVTSRYGHMRNFNVQLGQRVYKGQTILGLVGTTGNVTGPHLHFEVREDGKAVNPLKYIGNW